MKSGINKLAKVLTVSLTKYKVTVTKGEAFLLVTNNNIQAYNKLYRALEDQEADIYILEHWGKKIGSSVDKNSFMSILRRWFEN